MELYLLIDSENDRGNSSIGYRWDRLFEDTFKGKVLEVANKLGCRRGVGQTVPE